MKHIILYYHAISGVEFWYNTKNITHYQIPLAQYVTQLISKRAMQWHKKHGKVLARFRKASRVAAETEARARNHVGNKDSEMGTLILNFRTCIFISMRLRNADQWMTISFNFAGCWEKIPDKLLVTQPTGTLESHI